MMSSKHDARYGRLLEWLREHFGDNAYAIAPASEDASFRRYFRVRRDGTSHIVMDAPTERENPAEFVRIARQFRAAGLNVPEIVAADLKQGFALISDFGSTTYLSVLTADNADALYDDALDSLVALQRASSADRSFLPPYDSRLLNLEMELFRQWYLGVHRAKDRQDGDDRILERAFKLLERKALEQPSVWVHLDYHSRNLMLLEKDSPGILDFQDARHGPITYDLVSLLRDCYIEWPQERVAAWVGKYLDKAGQAGLPVGDDVDRFIEWFDWMGLQRHLKVAGIFSRLNYRDGKPGYMDDIPLVLSYIHSISAKYERLRSLHGLIERLIERD